MVSNKSRLLRLYRYLYTNTDEMHYTTKAEIMEALRDDETIYSRQTVRDDIDTLTNEGYDIETIVSSGNYYFFGEREFSMDELRMLIDAVCCSRYMSKKQKEVLVRKLKGFCSKYQAETVERHMINLEKPESGDALAYEMVDLFNDAINRNRKLSFQLAEPGSRRRKLADSGASVLCTPVDLAWDGRSFYLVALTEPDREPALYAVSEIVCPMMLDEKGADRPKGFKADRFVMEQLKKDPEHSG